MTFTDRHIVEAYSGLFDGLSATNKKELIDTLSKSLNKDKEETDHRFFASFGAFASTKSAEEICKEIKESRAFSAKEIKL
jgi:hypothetical protein